MGTGRRVLNHLPMQILLSLHWNVTFPYRLCPINCMAPPGLNSILACIEVFHLVHTWQTLLSVCIVNKFHS